ncbi:MAG: hypothetical protein Q8O83_04435 [bacterium]|nr:hypothetical protein [bacterium]
MATKKTSHEDIRNNVVIWLSIAGFVLTVFGFIWFEYRPIVIRKQCYAGARLPNSPTFFEPQYRTCLAQNGLEI